MAYILSRDNYNRKRKKVLRALEKRKREREKAMEQAATYFRQLSGSVRLLAGVLYGSYARGDFNLSSDIDVIVIAEELPGHPLERWELLYSCITGGIEPKGYTVSEFKKLVDKRNPVALELLSEGIAITGTDFWKTLRAQA